jgi:hypothetical protein
MMRRTLLLGTALFLAMASASQAAITAEDIVAQYQSAGYQRIEVEVGVTRAKVEAIKDGQKIEVTYDLETGAVLKSETETLPAGADVTPGVEVKTSDDDDLDDSNDDLDDDEEDDHSGHGGGDDDSDDDHGGDSDDDSGDDSGDDDGDDHGGDRDDD